MQDFTFVCPTEIIAFSDKAQQFQQLNCQLIACSCDTEETHLAWIKTARKKGGLGHMQIPIMADTTKVSKATSSLHKAHCPLQALYTISTDRRWLMWLLHHQAHLGKSYASSTLQSIEHAWLFLPLVAGNQAHTHIVFIHAQATVLILH